MDTVDICRTDVLRLLRQLARDRLSSTSCLSRLQVVRDSLHAGGFAATPQACQLELAKLIMQVAESELHRLRKDFGQGIRVPGHDYRAHIARDFACGQRELEAWSALYHIYLRTDLDLGLDQFTRLVRGRHKRTVQRRLERGVDALTALLQDMEYGAIRAATHRRSATRIPVTSTHCSGLPMPVLHNAMGALCDPSGPQVISLGGPAGIGKTEVAARLARTLLGDRRFADAVWLSAEGATPSSLGSRSSLLPMIAEILRLGPDAIDTDLLGHLASQAVLVVIDGVEEPNTTAELYRCLEVIPPPSKALVTARVGWLQSSRAVQLQVPPLDLSASTALLRTRARRHGIGNVASARDPELAPLVAATSGHPGAILLAVAMLHSLDLETVTAQFVVGAGPALQLYRELHDRSWRSCGQDARALVLAAVSAHQGNVALDLQGVASYCSFPRSRLAVALDEALANGLLAFTGGEASRRIEPCVFVDRYVDSLASDACELSASHRAVSTAA